MSFKTVLLHLNSSQNCEPIIKAGVAIAEQHDAHLIGLYVIPPVVSYLGVPVPKVVSSFHSEYHNNLSAGVEKIFSEHTEGLPFTSEWRSALAAFSSIKNIVSQMAHTSDLLIVGNETSITDETLHGNQLESIITSTCRPTLIIPVDQKLAGVGKNILVAWDGTDESTRAVFDSLPLLKRSENVTVHRINPTGSVKHHTIGTSSEIVSTLARHGINAELSFSNRPYNEIATELFRIATQKGADTMVMGAYGHSKVHDMLVASVASEVLKKMKIPVLMSH